MDFLLYPIKVGPDDTRSVAFLSASSSVLSGPDFASSACIIEVISNLVDVFMCHDQAANSRFNAMLRFFAIALSLSKDIIAKEDFATSQNF